MIAVNFKVCPRCGQRAVHTMAQCGRCGYAYQAQAAYQPPQASAMRPCWTCGAQISRTARACPHCGEEFVESGSDVLAGLAAFLVVLFAIGIAGKTTEAAMTFAPQVWPLAVMMWGAIGWAIRDWRRRKRR